MQTEFHIGIDDTDSRLAGCTTYTATRLFQELESRGFQPIDYPWLIRLNPNIPWKTRGNGALSLHFAIDSDRLREARETALATVEESSDLTQRCTDPAVVSLAGVIPDALREFSDRALHDMISVPEARRFAHSVGAEVHLLKGSRGLIGALASIGADLAPDHTFEIIAYRKRENIGTPRRVSKDSIREMNERFRGSTFNNIDPETCRILVCPHGPDPVLLGIRGEDPGVLRQAFSEIRIDEDVDSTMIFKTNQGTDAHLKWHRTIAAIDRYQSVVINCRVQGKPRIIRGGHVIFMVEDETGSIDCAAYRETGSLRDAVLRLALGDRVTVSGGIRSSNGKLTLNIEKLEITELTEVIRFENPHCSLCGSRCESMGVNQEFRCKKCKARFPKSSMVRNVVPRSIGLGVYLPPPRAHRHLTKPLSRYGIFDPSATDAVGDSVTRTIGTFISIS